MSSLKSQTSTKLQLVNQGNKLRKEGKLDRAIEKYQAALRKDPKYVSALFQLSVTYERQKDFDRAYTHYQNLLKLQPNNSDVYARLARVMKQQGNIMAAIITFQKAIALQPKQPGWVYSGLGDVLYKNGDRNQAIEAYQKAVKINPKIVSNTYNKLIKNLKYKEDEAQITERANQQTSPEAIASHVENKSNLPAISDSVSTKPYIFIIGLNKCGTTSLHSAFIKLGWNPLHEPYQFNEGIDKAVRNGKKLLHYLQEYNCFSDLYYPFRLSSKEFKNSHSLLKLENTEVFLNLLNGQYPNSKFICNIRNKKDWLDSRKKHVLRNKEKKRYTGQWLTIEKDVWSQEYDEHYDRILKYFKNHDNFLLMNFDELQSYDSLCEFLQVPILDEKFPRRNRTAAIEKNQKNK